MAGVCSLQAMAASASIAQLGSASNGVMASSKLEFAPLKVAPRRQSSSSMVGTTTCQAASSGAAKVPDLGKRRLMNLLLLGAIGLPTAEMVGPYLYFLVPPGAGSASSGVNAKDALGNDITVAGWLKAHPPGDRTLSQGLKGDPTYLVVESDGTLGNYGVNAVCTHLGCVVPYNPNEKKFICPCHGSQYNNQGKVVRGPAPLSLALAHVGVDESGTVTYAPWTETDFRTGEKPWWA